MVHGFLEMVICLIPLYVGFVTAIASVSSHLNYLVGTTILIKARLMVQQFAKLQLLESK